MKLLHSWLRIEDPVVDLRTEVSFDLFETIHKFLGMLVGILFQPAEVSLDFGLCADKPGGHALCIFRGVDVSTNFHFDLWGKGIHQYHRREGADNRVKTYLSSRSGSLFDNLVGTFLPLAQGD